MLAASEITGLVILFGAGLAFLLALLKLFPGRRCAGVWLFPWMWYLPAPLVTLLGFRVASEDFRLRPKHLALFLPVATAGLAWLGGAPATWLLVLAPLHALLMILPLFFIFSAAQASVDHGERSVVYARRPESCDAGPKSLADSASTL